MDFRTYVTQEKKRLTQQRKDVQKRVTGLESELQALGAELKNIDNEMEAIQAYETAKAAVPAPARRRARRAEAAESAPAPAKKPRRRRKVSRRAEIVAVIASFGKAGAGRADIIQTLNVKGNKSAEQSVSNALAALKKSGEVAHGDGKYTAQAAEGSVPAAEAAEAPVETAAAAETEAAPRKTRRRRGPSRRAAIVSMIEASGSEGIGRADIIAQLNVKGDKSAEQAVSNALAALKKAGTVEHKDGKYGAPAAS